MKLAYPVLLLLLLLGPARPGWAQTLPPAPERVVQRTYFGTTVTDPFRWLEDPTRLETQEWYQMQGTFTDQEFGRMPGRGPLLRRLQELNQDPPPYTISDIQRVGKKLFFRKRTGADKYLRLWMRDGLGGIDKLLVDPGKGAEAAIAPAKIGAFAVSPNGRYVVYESTSGSSDLTVLKIFDTQTNKHIAETIPHSRVETTAWLPDNKTFVYNRLAKVSDQKGVTRRSPVNQLYTHSLGTKPATDRLIFGNAYSATVKFDEALKARGGLCPGSPNVVAYIGSSTTRTADIYMAPLASVLQKKGSVAWRRVAGQEDQVIAAYAVGNYLYGLTTLGSAAGQVVRTSLQKPAWGNAEAVLTLQAPIVLETLSLGAENLFAVARDGSASQLWRIPLPKGNQSLKVPEPDPLPLTVGSTVIHIATEPSRNDLLLTLQSWIAAPLVFHLDSDELTETDLQPAGDYDIPDHLAVFEVKVKSADGTPIPLTLIYRRGMKLNGQHPTMLWAYGAYGHSELPHYDPVWLAWLERGGVLGIAHVRGGGEYGEPWHQAARGAAKPTAWQDYLACAQHLIDKDYATPDRIVAQGAGAGALVVAGAVMEKPELFGAMLIDRGLMDMVLHDSLGTIAADVEEFGSLRTEGGFRSRFVMSPYHRIQDRKPYPATLVNAVFPEEDAVDWQAAKFTARLHNAVHNRRPVMLRVEPRAHPLLTRQRALELLADQLSFIFWQVDNAAFQPVTLAKRKRAKKVEGQRVIAKGR